MASRLTTLVYIGRERIVRCDVDPTGRQPRSVWSRARPLSAEAPTLVEAALRQDAARPGKVWVLSEEFWTQKLAISSDALQGLAGDEIGRALGFEAESLSGQSAVDSELGQTPLGSGNGLREFWVVQIPTWIRNQIAECVQKTGGRLMGLLHPGGLPLSLDVEPSSTALWRRTESWSGITIGVGRGEDGAARHTLVNGDIRSSATVRALDEWAAAQAMSGQTQQLSEVRRATDAGGAETLSLADDATLGQWLEKWGQVLARPIDSLPFVGIPQQPLSPRARAAISIGLAASVALLAALDGWSIERRLDAYEAEIKQAKAAKTKLDGTQKQIGNLAKQQQELKKGVDRLAVEVARTRDSVRAIRARWQELLNIVASECPAKVVVREIAHGESEPALRGVSLGDAALNEFAARLSARLAPYGWTIAPSHQAVADPGGDPQLYHFTLTLVEAPVAPSAPAADTVANRLGEGRP